MSDTNQKIILALILFGLGLLGIMSLLTVDIPLPAEAAAILQDRFTPIQIKLLTLVNPTLFLIVAVVVGTLLYHKVNLKVPIIEKIVGGREHLAISNIIKYGIIGGVSAGVLLSLSAYLFNPMLPDAFKELSESIKLSFGARFLYGGFTEEILMRFGFMTFVVWICSLIFRNTKSIVMWSGIVLAALIFALGHLPVVYNAVENPSVGLITYIIVLNSIGGIVFGWLYWKKGLESAFIAHIFAHVVMVLVDIISN